MASDWRHRVAFGGEKCPNDAEHTTCPENYLAWHEWAAEMEKSHAQTQCPVCTLWAIWVPRVVLDAGDR